MKEDEKNGNKLSQNLQISKIYDDYNAPLRGFVKKRVKSIEDTDDILQNVFYKLSQLDLSQSPITDISGWLYTVARNMIVDKKRKKTELSLYQDTDAETTVSFIKEVTEVLVDIDSPEIEYLKSLVWQELDEALQELPEEQRIVFELSELEGFSFKEISEGTGVGINTLLSRKRYAILHLRKRLAETYEDLFFD